MAPKSRKKITVRSRPRTRTAPPNPAPPAAPLAVPTPEPPAPPVFRVHLADCVNVTITNCRAVTISDNGAYVHVEGEGHGRPPDWTG